MKKQENAKKKGVLGSADIMGIFLVFLLFSCKSKVIILKRKQLKAAFFFF